MTRPTGSAQQQEANKEADKQQRITKAVQMVQDGRAELHGRGTRKTAHEEPSAKRRADEDLGRDLGRPRRRINAPARLDL
ncbi:hypothetical protein GGX14DRAFT_555554 [Mycena pura]|uniref:Uncharacterized protein n=1 Tax=Mycena pura TaxID=153505 RepID=A0AAD6YR65_9AGAR|nr:hypothetical protein GGX14DRAFT_555554 [Mycena pura]